MQIHELKTIYKFKKRKRVGRGGKRGTYAGKGSKGQKARSGTGGTNIAEKGRSSWIKRLPKLGGFKSSYSSNVIVKTSTLEKKYQDNEEVNPLTLREKKIISQLERGKSGKKQKVKILKDIQISKKINVKDCLLSKSALKVIEQAGGKLLK